MLEGCGELASVELPEGLETLSRNVFSGCRKLKSIRLPRSLKTIDDYAFAYCKELRRIFIPSSVEYMGFCVFWQSNVYAYCEADDVPKGWSEGWSCGTITYTWGNKRKN